MQESKEILKSLAHQAALSPQEEMLAVRSRKKQLYIGIPKEISFQEKRVALVPEAVELLVSNGQRVVVETGAGKLAHFSDNEYSEAGAEIAYDAQRVYESDIILKVAPPSKEEISMMKVHQTLLSALQLNIHPKDTLQILMGKKITAIAWDFIKDDGGIYPAVRSMGEIAGNTAILIAAEYLSNVNDGTGLMFGGIAGVSPSEVVILGAGTVGEFATKAAQGLGASVKVFDTSISRLRRLQIQIGFNVYTSILQPAVLKRAIANADVVIGAMRALHGRTPCVVTEKMVADMREGSVIVDVSIDRGGCFETSKVTNHDHPVYEKHGVIHYCVPNIPSRVSRTASFALSNIFAPILLSMANEGGCSNMIKHDAGFRNGTYIYNGTLTSEILGEAFGLPYKNIELLLYAL